MSEASARPEDAAKGPASKRPSKKPGAVRRLLMTVLKLGLAVGLLAWLFSRGSIDQATVELPLRSPGTVTLILVLAAAGLSMSGIRWWLLLGAEGIQISVLTAVRLTYIGHFWNMVIPGAVSGDAVKMLYVGRLVPPEQREESWSTVFADRLIGLGALVSVSAFAALTDLNLFWGRPELRAMFLFMLAVLLGFVSVGVVISLGIGQNWRLTRFVVSRLPLQQSLSRVWHTLQRLGRQPKRVAAAYGISLFAHMIAVTNACLVGLIFTKALTPLQYYAVIPVGLFSNAIPLSPGGFGVGESVLEALFKWVGAGNGSPEELGHAGASVMVWLRLIMFCLALVGGLLYAAYKGQEPPPAQGDSPDLPPG